MEKRPGLSKEALRNFEHQLEQEIVDMKVSRFLEANPVSQAFLRREKGRLPYSVFKATA